MPLPEPSINKESDWVIREPNDAGLLNYEIANFTPRTKEEADKLIQTIINNAEIVDRLQQKIQHQYGNIFHRGEFGNDASRLWKLLKTIMDGENKK